MHDISSVLGRIKCNHSAAALDSKRAADGQGRRELAAACEARLLVAMGTCGSV